MESTVEEKSEKHDDDDTTSDQAATNRRRHQSYTPDFKLHVIAAARDSSSSKRAVAKRFGIDARRVRAWCSQEQTIAALPLTRRRVEGAGRKPVNAAIERELVTWIRQRREQRLLVTRRMVQDEARSLHRSRDDGDSGFKASDSWLTCFMRRHSVSFKPVVVEFDNYLP